MKRLLISMLTSLVMLLPLMTQSCEEQAGQQHENYCADHHGAWNC